MESSIELQSLLVIAYLTPELSNNVSLSINLVLKLSFFQIAELLGDKSILACNSIKDSIGITLSLRSKGICLLTYSKLVCSQFEPSEAV